MPKKLGRPGAPIQKLKLSWNTSILDIASTPLVVGFGETDQVKDTVGSNIAETAAVPIAKFMSTL
jgi:hypothetical protein